MSYRAGMGVALPMYRGAAVRRGVTARGVTARRAPVWGAAGLGVSEADAMTRQCLQYADAGACLSRLAARGVPITISGPGYAHMAGLGQIGRPLGAPVSVRTAGPNLSVSGQWAQRAVNAYYAHNGAITRIHVGGAVGPLTMAGLRAAAHILPPTAAPGDLAVSNDPGTARNSSRAILSHALVNALSALPMVPDPGRPPRPTHRTTSTSLMTASSSSRTSPSTGKVPGASDAPPTDTTGVVGTDASGNPVVVDEGGNMPGWLVPALIAGSVVVAGGIGYSMWSRGGGRRAPTAVTANRGKRRKSTER